MDEIITQGMAVAFIRHFENMKQLDNYYWYYKRNPSADFIYPEGESMNYVSLFKDNLSNNLINLLNLPISNQVNYFQ